MSLGASEFLTLSISDMRYSCLGKHVPSNVTTIFFSKESCPSPLQNIKFFDVAKFLIFIFMYKSNKNRILSTDSRPRGPTQGRGGGGGPTQVSILYAKKTLHFYANPKESLTNSKLRIHNLQKNSDVKISDILFRTVNFRSRFSLFRTKITDTVIRISKNSNFSLRHAK